MNDSDLRALVRDAVARHLGDRAREAGAAAHATGAPGHAPVNASARSAVPGPQPHPSHVMYLALINEGDACLIEPAVPCNHCGYCRSHGH